MRPPALRRGPSANAQCSAVGGQAMRAARASAASPGLAARAATRRPWATSARLSPVSGTTSQIVPSATRSSQRRRSGSGRRTKWPRARSARLSATTTRKVTPTAASSPTGLTWSRRLGLITASAAGSSASATWWSTTMICWPARRSGGERLERGGAAVERDHEAAALAGEALQRLRIGPVAFAQAVRHVDRGRCADGGEIAGQKRDRSGAVDVVVAEQPDALVRLYRIGEPLDRVVEIQQMRRVGQGVAQLAAP